ncbi:S4 domain-containing protein YaaA [Staphylococcus sp. EG-SA-6]|uniref:S4 domain-containing protein YaaA n=1 Tax=Staphylococcus haemolyticus TaxID=1283 RepID=A0ABU3IEX4_STAHA|nr:MULTISPECIES: S4 domain-containing protein YaaA [Staphylococcus]MBN4933898.1 S4 domain-containing protein YaaA [Staphylococcus sp. EG-SA-6]MDU2097309.1 S4 domain-containing protein YaaA [Staphylococcus sp.]MBC3014077.1 S4 domain-containing protein YaaA [Staphylococcus haemolyticus]MBC3102736.1 S4 domain-containing protein YaaA [Staphylococcus haemolyticus]MBC3105543.1 S4 domain-containing protein YaaA [Staphylococcus haemolyticus]
MIILVQEVVVEGDITLGQFLKTEGIIESGGQAKWFLQDVEVLINGERETRRGKKLANQDRIDFPDIPEIDSVIIIHQGEQ